MKHFKKVKKSDKQVNLENAKIIKIQLPHCTKNYFLYYSFCNQYDQIHVTNGKRIFREKKGAIICYPIGKVIDSLAHA